MKRISIKEAESRLTDVNGEIIEIMNVIRTAKNSLELQSINSNDTLPECDTLGMVLKRLDKASDQIDIISMVLPLE